MLHLLVANNTSVSKVMIAWNDIWFTNAEYVNTHFMYSFYDGNAKPASRESCHKNPGSKWPDRHIFAMVGNSPWETRAFIPSAYIDHSKQNMQNEEEELNDVLANQLELLGQNESSLHCKCIENRHIPVISSLYVV
jgi:hypothetical protein